MLVSVRVQSILLRGARVLGTLCTVLIGLIILAAGAVYILILRNDLKSVLSLPAFLLHSLCSLWLLGNVSANYLMLVRIPAGTPAVTAAAAQKDVEGQLGVEVNEVVETPSMMYRFCEKCNAPKPPRAHHCRICDVCVARMCHHCPALGRCVGRDNYCFYFRFLWYAVIGCAFTFCSCAYLLSFPQWKFPSDHEQTSLLTAVVSLGLAVSVGILAIAHIALVVTGQTTIEVYENWEARSNARVRDIPLPAHWGRLSGPFNKGLQQNFQDALGVPPSLNWPWWSVLLCPFPRGRAREY